MRIISHTISILSMQRTMLSRRYMATSITPVSEIKSLVTEPHPFNNIPESIVGKLGRNLHLIENHPLGIIKKRIEDYCNDYAAKNTQSSFTIYDNLMPIVSTKQCFDDLLVEATHVSRKPTDTYYLNESTVLRTHTSAHQVPFLAQGVQSFLCTGDVYRRDEVDSSHYPAFHQMEGVRIFPDNAFPPNATIEEKKKIVEADLKALLSGLSQHLFGVTEYTWREDRFPFTHPSFELEVKFGERWLEVLGCGVIHDKVIENAVQQRGSPLNGQVGWAFGLGLERLAMVLFDIPDIRLFWTQDERFLSQFRKGEITKFRPYSKYPICYKDVSFWLPDSGLHVNDVYEVIRNEAGDLVEKVEHFDQFVNKKTGKTSHAYRVNYRSMDRSLLNSEIDQIQERVRQKLVDKLGVTLR